MLARVPFIPRLETQRGDGPLPHTWAIVLTGDAAPSPARGHRSRRHRAMRWPRSASGPLGPSRLTTLERASMLVPPGQMVTVTTRDRAPAWDRELALLPRGLRVTQPSYRGGAAELLLPLLKIARRDPSATVIVLPTAQRVNHEARFVRYVGRAVWAVAVRPDVPLLIGAHPTSPVSDGWVEPGAPIDGLESLGVCAIERFVDDASPAEQRRLLDDHALVSTSILVGRAATLLALAQRALPDVLEALEPLEEVFDRPEESLLAEAIYECMPEVDVAPLERAPELGVLALPDVVWRAPAREMLQLLAS
jgi:mannose-1-phosphate guanylyltransferase